MNRLIFFVIVLFVSALAYGQGTSNRVITDPKLGIEVCLGFWEADSLEVSSLFASYFQMEKNYEKGDKKKIKKLSKLLKNKEVVIVFGSWCSDSQREVPRMIALLRAAKFSFKKMKLIGVDRAKTAEEIDLTLYKIQYVPTLIVYENGKELGRIVEAPSSTLLDDLHIILSQK
jgi:thiol-disulfide isomerase/thioredoxin